MKKYKEQLIFPLILAAIFLPITLAAQMQGIADLTKIKFYRDPVSNHRKAVMLADNGVINTSNYNFVIDLNINTLTCKYITTNIRLLYLVVTNNKIGVLGMNSFNRYSVFSHNKSDVFTVNGKTVTTSPIHQLYIDPKYHMTNITQNSEEMYNLLSDIAAYNNGNHYIAESKTFNTKYAYWFDRKFANYHISNCNTYKKYRMIRHTIPHTSNISYMENNINYAVESSILLYYSTTVYNQTCN